MRAILWAAQSGQTTSRTNNRSSRTSPRSTWSYVGVAGRAVDQLVDSVLVVVVIVVLQLVEACLESGLLISALRAMCLHLLAQHACLVRRRSSRARLWDGARVSRLSLWLLC